MDVTDLQGRCRQVPPPGDEVQWTRFRAWLSHLIPADQDADTGAIAFRPEGQAELKAHPGDWIIRNGAGVFYVTHEREAA